MISDRLGLVLKQLRVDRGWSQQEMADRSHVLRGYLSRVECGKTVPAWENMERFALTLGVSVAEIIRLAEGPVEVKIVDGAGPVLVESSPSPGRDRDILSSRTGSLDSLPIEAPVTYADLGRALLRARGTPHPAQQLAEHLEKESQESIRAAGFGTENGQPYWGESLVQLAVTSRSESPASVNEPISELE